jgi:CheY-like chemotaxis protein
MHVKRGSVLLVEDDADDATLVYLAFKKIGLEHALTVVSDGSQALNYLSREGLYSDPLKFPTPALMLLDLLMPRIDGLEVLKWIRSHKSLNRLPVIVLTGSVRPRDFQFANSLGVNSFIQKPHGFDQLCLALRTFAEFWFGCCKFPNAPT